MLKYSFIIFLFLSVIKSLFYKLESIDYVYYDRFYFIYLFGASLLLMIIETLVSRKRVFLFAGFVIPFVFLSYIIFNTILKGVLQTEMQNIFLLATIFFIYFFFINNYHDNPGISTAIYEVLILAGFILSFAGILKNYYSIHDHVQIMGNFRNENLLSMILAFTFPASISYQLFTETKNIRQRIFQKLSLINLLIIPLICIINTSRTAIIGIVTISIVAVILKKMEQKINWFSWRKLVLFIAVFLVFITSAFYYLKPASANGRIFIDQITIKGVLNKPLAGHGYNSFKLDYPEYQQKYFEHNPVGQTIYLADDILNSFNEFSQVFFELGIIGFILFGGLFFYYLNKAYRTTGLIDKTFSITFLLILFITSLFYNILRDYDLIAIIFLNALAMGYPGKPIPVNSKIGWKYFICLLALFVCIYMSVKTITYNVSQQAWYKSSKQDLSDTDLKAFADKYDKDLSFNGEYCYYMGALFYKRGNLVNAKDYLRKALTIYTSTKTLTYLGNVYSAENKTDSAIFYYKKAKNIVPSRFIPREKLMSLYLKIGDTVLAQKEAHSINNLQVKTPSFIVDSIKNRAIKTLSY